MGKTGEIDSKNSFIQVGLAIKSLMDFNDDNDQDDVSYAANKLKSVLRMVHDNYQSWSREAIREFVLSKNDPLRYINVKSDGFNKTVRKIQEDMINKFSVSPQYS